jgi:RNA polymerase sigma-70 factor, ECF subfamily
MTTEAEQRFDRLFRAHHAPILRYLQRRAAPEDAADVAAEVFLVAWRRLVDVPDDAPLLWLYGIAHRTLANHRRSSRRHAALSATLAAALRQATPADRDGSDDDRQRVRAALATLPVEDRELVTLNAWEGLSAGQIAIVTGLRPGTVRVRLHRARARLRAALSADASSEQEVVKTVTVC